MILLIGIILVLEVLVDPVTAPCSILATWVEINVFLLCKCSLFVYPAKMISGQFRVTIMLFFSNTYANKLLKIVSSSTRLHDRIDGGLPLAIPDRILENDKKFQLNFFHIVCVKDSFSILFILVSPSGFSMIFESK